MNQKSTSTNTVAQITFRVILGFVLVFAITTLRGTALGRLSPTQGATSVITSSFTPGLDETHTVAAIITLKAIEGATEAPRTPIPYTPPFLPSGMYEDEPVKHSGNMLGLDTQNGWSGFVVGYHFFIYAGALLSDSEQGAIVMVTTMPSGTSIEQLHSPAAHTWYARATVDANGRIVDVEGLAAYKRKLAAAASGTVPTKRKRNATRADYLSWRYADCPSKAPNWPTGIGHELSDRDALRLASGFGAYRRTLRCAFCRTTLGDYIDKRDAH